MKYAGGLEQEDRQHLWHWVENMGFHVAVQLPLWGEQVGQGSLMGQLSVQCLHLYNIWHLMSVLGHRDRTWSRDLCETVWTSPTRPSYLLLNLERFERFERFISLSKKHKAPGACTKLPRRLKTNLRYETSPQSRPVVGNTKLGELYWVLSDNKTSLPDFAVRAKTDRRTNLDKEKKGKFLKENGRRIRK